MAGQTFRYRTILEVATISIMLYLFLGFSGFSNKADDKDESSRTSHSNVTTGKLVYPAKNLQCQRHDYQVKIFSTSPLVIYIDHFLSDTEADHLIELRYDIACGHHSHARTTDISSVQIDGKSPPSRTKASKA